MSPGAVVTVRLVDTSYADGPSELIGEQVIPDPGRVPIDFRVPYSLDAIDPRNTYFDLRTHRGDGRSPRLRQRHRVRRDNPR
ncbi:MAG: YbaY family lipoprotein [bacterium]|nr:YbaY family lipoprotein [bacterium]